MPRKISFLRTAAAMPFAAVLLYGQGGADPLAGFDIPATISRPAFSPGAFADVFGAYRGPFLQYLDAKFSLSARVYRVVLRQIENGRVDEQAGAPPNTAGVASAAEKAGTTGLVTAALESGALTQTLNQNVLTVRGNVDGLSRFLSRRDLLPTCVSAEAACRPSPLNNVELSASFDVSGSNTTLVSGVDPNGGAPLAALLSSGRRQLASAGARYVLVNSRDLQSAAYRKAWSDWYTTNLPSLRSAGAGLLTALDQVLNKAAATPAVDAGGLTVYELWAQGARAALVATPRTEAAIRPVLTEQLDRLEVQIRTLDPDLDTHIAAAVDAWVRYFNATRQGFQLGNLPMLTLEGTYLQPALQPRLVDLKLVFAWSPKAKGTVNPGTLTLNGGVSLYTAPQIDSVRKTTTRWRDAQAALQFDRPMAGNGAPAIFALGAYLQYQVSPGLILIPPGAVAPFTNLPLPADATALLSSRGTIAVGYASVTLHLPNSGVRLPVGISWSNRTELVAGSEIRAHIGLDFDSHSLLLGGK
jgi:hypothetical protein